MNLKHILMSLLVLLCVTASAQDSSFFRNHYKSQFGVFAGIGDNSSTVGELGNVLGLEVRAGKHVGGILQVYNGEFISFQSPPEHSQDVSVFYGLSTSSRNLSAEIIGGAGVIEYVWRGKHLYNTSFLNSTYETQSKRSVCGTVALKAMVHGRGIGVGVIGNANFNTIQSYAGWYVFLQAGWAW